MSPAKSLNENPGCLSIFTGKRKKGIATDADPYPYGISDKFISPAELNFYLQAREILSGKYIVCPKISLAELLEVKAEDRSQWQTAFNKISAKRIDFLVCEAATMKPVYGIELDDASHDRPDRAKRDLFVDNVFRVVELPLLHVDCKEAYSHQEMVELLLAPFQQNSNRSASEAAQNSQVFCTKCGAPMRKRLATDGPHSGEYYWVCSQYPKCSNFYPAGERAK